jgi:hypothetical protein
VPHKRRERALIEPPALDRARLWPLAGVEVIEGRARYEPTCTSEPVDSSKDETGGWLLAPRPSPSRIVHATAPGEDAEHNPTNMRLGSERLEAVRSTHPYLIPVGLWHLHDADPTLSVADREHATERGA